MGTIKIDFDLPEFEKELNINVIIRKDGEVVCSSSSSPYGNFEEKVEKPTPRTTVIAQEKVATKKSTGTSKSGNLMSIDL